MNITVDPAKLSAARPAAEPEAATDVVLSICVPTYNRAIFLRHLFPHIREVAKAFDFSYEIVVSDNCSPDETPEIVEDFIAEGLPIRYFRQEENKRLSNLFSAFRHARGEFLVYLADDDLIIAEALADNVRFMRDNPEIRVLYTPWELYDAVSETAGAPFYRLPQPLQVFKPGQEIDLLKMMIDHHVLPEIALYRSTAVREIVSAPRFCHWSFTYLSTMISQGPIAFRDVRYYRSVTLTPVAPNRYQEGTQDALQSWDDIRGGLEFMIFSLLKRHGLTPDTELAVIFRGMVDHFLRLRMHVSLRLWLGRRDYLRAYELIARLSYLNPGSVQNIAGLDTLLPRLKAQILAQLANGIAEIERLAVFGVEDVETFETELRDLGLKPHIAVVGGEALAGGEAGETTFAFIRDEAMRQDLLDAGHEPGLIVSAQDIEANFPL